MIRLGILRDIKEDELALMLSWRNEPSVRANMYTQHEISLDEHLAWWSRIEDREDQKYFMYEMDNTASGIVAINEIDTVKKEANWAFYASPEATQGTGSRMEYLALEYAFNELELDKLNCEVLAFNTPVIKLHQKFGFKVQDILKEKYKTADGYEDIYQLRVLASDWFKLREAMFEKLTKLSRRKQ